MVDGGGEAPRWASDASRGRRRRLTVGRSLWANRAKMSDGGALGRPMGCSRCEGLERASLES